MPGQTAYRLPKPRRKNLRPRLFVAFLLVAALGAGLALREWLGQPVAEAGIPSTTSSVSGEGLAEDGARHGAPGQDSQVQAAGGVELSATNLRVEGDQFLADVCFDMPDGSDWTIWKASLTHPGGVIDSFGLTLIEVREPAVDGKQFVTRLVSGTKEVTVLDVSGDAPGRRCDTLYFDLPQDNPRSAFTIQVDSIAAPPREGETCSGSNLEKLQHAIQERAPGIVIACEQGIGYEGIVLKAWPEGTSRSEAENTVYGEDLFLDVYGRRGPWVFRFPVP